MKNQLLKSIFTVFVTLCTVLVCGQDTQTQLMNRINTFLKEGKCDDAQLLYDAWKDLTNKTNSSVETRIRDCKSGNSSGGSGNRHPGEPEMVFVQGGTFTMGCTSEQGDDCMDPWEKPTRRVTLSSFSIGKYQVTQAQWVAVMGSNPSFFKGFNLPVESVSWNDAQEFIRKLNAATGKKYRLPTEAEWEFAARGGNKSRGFKYSGSNNIEDVAWYRDNSGDKIHPVGTKSPNELGIYDMSGNVYEWCSDWIDLYPSSAQTNPQGPSSGTTRVKRGGRWNRPPITCRVSTRIASYPDHRLYGSGFRLVLVP